jgi:tetratricopeptide (TPR) repeat protein
LTHLRGAFERFAEVGRDEDAVRVATELVRSRGADRELAEHLEKLSSKIKNLDALSTAHDLIARDMTGIDRARELVRQAEARVAAGSPRLEAIQHGEAGLTSVPPLDAEEFLKRLGALADKPSDVVDLYERQVSRCKSPTDRAAALARAAQIASAHKQVDRARGFYDLALSGAPADEAVATLEASARAGDIETGGDALRRALAGALENGGQGARDGGRTRGGLLRRAALLTHHDLKDLDEAFVLLGVALVAHVDPVTLDALEALAHEIGNPRRAEETLSHVLEEVFDGPLVRQLLARRAKLRREHLADTAGAAADLKKLHDLSPNDSAVLSELTALLTELGDYRGMVRVFEDQILRGKDMSARAELARKVAQMWEVELSDPREAADAWRRVLRMKQGDAEATAGLERAKANMLKTLDPASERKPSVAPAPPLPAAEGPPEAATPAAEASPVEGPAGPHGESPRASSGTATPVPVEEIVPRDTLTSNVYVHAGTAPAVEMPIAPGTAVQTPPASPVDADVDAPEERDQTHLDIGPVHHDAEAAHPNESSVVTPVPTEHDGPDFTDTTYPHSAAPSPPTESELVVDVDASGESEAIDVDVLLPEEITEGEEAPAAAAAVEEAPPKPSANKRSIPPPLPRSGSN